MNLYKNANQLVYNKHLNNKALQSFEINKLLIYLFKLTMNILLNVLGII